MKLRTLMGLVVLALLVASCAHQPPPDGGAPIPGFLLGLLHGSISLFSLIASLFVEVRVYQYPNAGFPYDAGFVLGMLIFYGGGRTTYVYTRSR